MQYRILGKTGISISSLGFGASPLGGVFSPVETVEGIKAVQTAIDMGMNLFDCSPYYGDLKAEMVLGSALKGIPRDKYLLSTKIGRYWRNGKKHWDYSAERAVSSVEESLSRLNAGHIDFIHCHDIEFADPGQVIGETLPALHRLRESGKVRFVGITGLPLQDLKNIVEKADPGMVDLVISFCHYTLQDDSLLDYLDFFKTKNVGVINASPFAMGLLSEKAVPGWHPADEDIKKFCRKAAEFCRHQGVRIEKLALQYSVNHIDVPTTLVGLSNHDEVIQNIHWINEPIDNIMVQEVLNILKPVHRKTWNNS
jgi:aryl-alcohol dehydrogenase-like predicted oxidoreductase